MSAKPLTFLLCERVAQDIHNPNKLSFIGVFSGFTTGSLPFISPPMFLAVQYGLGQGEFLHRFEIQHSSGQVIYRSPEHTFFLDNRTVTHTDIVGVEGILFSHPGQYWVKTLLNNEDKGEVPLHITYKPPDIKVADERGQD